jgi:hypothetical protein
MSCTIWCMRLVLHCDSSTYIMIVYVKLLHGSCLHLCWLSQVAARVLSVQESWVHVLARTLSFVAIFLCFYVNPPRILHGQYCQRNRMLSSTSFYNHFNHIYIYIFFFCINKCWVTEELVAFYLSFLRSQIFASDLCFLIKLFMKCGPKYVTAAPFTIYFHPDVSRLNESSIIIVCKATHVLTSKACGGMKL